MTQKFLQFDIKGLNIVKLLAMDKEDVLVIRALLLNPDVGVPAIETVKIIKPKNINEVMDGTYFDEFERKALFKTTIRGEAKLSIKLFVIDRKSKPDLFINKIFGAVLGSVFGLATGGVSNTILAAVTTKAGDLFGELNESDNERVLVIGEGSVLTDGSDSEVNIELVVREPIIKHDNERVRVYGSKLLQYKKTKNEILSVGPNGSISISVKRI
jgi:hypothetical protein